MGRPILVESSNVAILFSDEILKGVMYLVFVSLEIKNPLSTNRTSSGNDAITKRIKRNIVDKTSICYNKTYFTNESLIFLLLECLDKIVLESKISEAC